MKVKVNYKFKKANKDYPRLMISDDSDGLIVLMVNDGDGVVVGHPTPSYPMGTYETDWITGYFVDFNGEVTLSND